MLVLWGPYDIRPNHINDHGTLQIIPQSIAAEDNYVTLLDFVGETFALNWVVSVGPTLKGKIKCMLLLLCLEDNGEFLAVWGSSSFNRLTA